MQYYNLTTRVIVELTMVLFLNSSIQSFAYATFRYKNLLSNKRLRSSSGELSRICSGSFCATSHDTITSSQSHKVGIILPENKDHWEIGQDLAKTLGVPILYENDDDATKALFDNFLHIMPYQMQSIKSYAISIQQNVNISNRPGSKLSDKRQKKNVTSMQPFFIDFCPNQNSKLGQRLGKQIHNQGGEKLLKAVAPMKLGEGGNGAVVFDLNAGFGQDSILMAGGGASKVHMVERHPIVGLLLSDAMRRLGLVASLDSSDSNSDDVSRARDLHQKLLLHQCDSVEFSKSIRSQEDTEKPDVCYLDPMFPPRTKSSAVKKNMQILHGLFQNSDEIINRIQEEQDLLNEAILLAKKRVVVKRPINAFPLGMDDSMSGDIKVPSYDLKGSINRFDVYVL